MSQQQEPRSLEDRTISSGGGGLSLAVIAAIAVAVVVGVGFLVVRGITAATSSTMPDVSRLSNAEFDAINGASCGQLEVMIASNTGQFRDFAQWKHDARC